ncbi:MAG: hypothetical protein AAF961_18460, partial [Planctomycetota bacterium]
MSQSQIALGFLPTLRSYTFALIVVAGLSPSNASHAFVFHPATPLPHNTIGTPEASTSISADNLTLYFTNLNDGLSVMTRPEVAEDFDPPTLVSSLPTLNHPELSRDDLALYGNMSGGGIVAVRR